RAQDNENRLSALPGWSQEIGVGEIFLAVQDDAGPYVRLAQQSRQRRPGAFGQRGRLDRAVHAERDLAVGLFLELVRLGAVETLPQDQRPEHVGLTLVDPDRYGLDPQNAVLL